MIDCDEDDTNSYKTTSKIQCLEFDWSNPKVVKAIELAYWIDKYNISHSEVPDERKKSVKKELKKLQSKHLQEDEVKLIESKLSVYERISVGFSIKRKRGEKTGYILEPSLFKKIAEVEKALYILDSIVTYEKQQQDQYHYTYRNRNYSRDITRLLEAMEKVHDGYIELGGNSKDFNDLVEQIERPQKKTLKEEVKYNRESYEEEFIKLRISKTRAKKITNAIIDEAYKSLK